MWVVCGGRYHRIKVGGSLKYVALPLYYAVTGNI